MQIKIIHTETIIIEGKKVLRSTLETGQHLYQTTLNKKPPTPQTNEIIKALIKVKTITKLPNGQYQIIERDQFPLNDLICSHVFVYVP